MGSAAPLGAPGPLAGMPGQSLAQPQQPAAPPLQPDNSMVPRDSLIGRAIQMFAPANKFLKEGIGIDLPGIVGAANEWRDQHRSTLLALAGGLAGAPSIGTGLSRAFAAAGPASQVDLQNSRINQTEVALRNKGIAPDIARAAAGNPALLQQILPQFFGAKQLQHVTIKDSLGNDIPMTFDPSTGRYRDVSGQVVGGQGGQGAPGAGGVPGLAGAAATLPPVIDPNTGRDEAFLQALGPVDRAAVTSILNGDANAQGRNMQKYLPYAARAEPGFSQQTYQTRLTTMRDFAPQGVSGKNLTAISTGLGHLDRLNGAIDKLGNFTYAPGLINPAYNAARSQLSPEYQRDVAAFRSDVNAVSGEMEKAFRAIGMSEAGIQHWRESFGENASPETMRGGAQEALHLLDSRLEAIGASYNRGMGLSSTKPAPELLSPEGRRIHNKLIGGGEAAASAPQAASAPASREAALVQARDAIARGAPRAAVAERLRQAGVDPSGL
jgi:hypothetical protein